MNECQSVRVATDDTLTIIAMIQNNHLHESVDSARYPERIVPLNEVYVFILSKNIVTYQAGAMNGEIMNSDRALPRVCASQLLYTVRSNSNKARIVELTYQLSRR